MSAVLDPQRTLAELKELRELTSDQHGAQRVAFSDAWVRARDWLASKLAELPVETHRDAAGNLWSTLVGDSPQALLLGGHMDSVPNGGWLDGCLNTLAGLEVMRRFIGEFDGRPPVTIRLVDWADEEGARFGKSLFGSSAFSGHLDMAEARQLTDKDGISLPEALGRVDISFENVLEAQIERAGAFAYLELHIEQGPVLLDLGLPLGVVAGTFGVERHAISFTGQAAHSGSTPMKRRKDAFLAAARMAPEIHRIADRHGGVCTIGSCVTKPGIVTSVAAECHITLDQRHLDPQALAAMRDEAMTASRHFADETGCTVAWSRLCHIAPVHFDPQLIAFACEAVEEIPGSCHTLPSGPLHDASEVSRSGIPTAMIFVQSLHGLSHNAIEDTHEDDIVLAIRALDRLASKAIRCATVSPGQAGSSRQSLYSTRTRICFEYPPVS